MTTMPTTAVKGRFTAKQRTTTSDIYVLDMTAAFSGAALASGDWIFVLLGSSGSMANTHVPVVPAGFVNLFAFRNMGQPNPNFSGTTTWGVWAKKRVAGETNYTITVDRSGTHTNVITLDVFWIDGTNVPDSSEWVLGTPKSRFESGGTTIDTAPSIATTVANSAAFAFFAERTSATDTDANHVISGTGWTKATATFLESIAASSGTFDIATKPMPTVGATGDVSRNTTTTTQGINGQAFQLVIPPIADAGPVFPPRSAGVAGNVWSGGAVVPGNWFVKDADGTIHGTTWAGTVWPGYRSVADMLAQPFFYCAHRGGSRNWPEHSMQGYTQSAIRGYGALEISLARTSDGVWFGLHDSYLDRTSLGNAGGTTLRASTMTWAQVQAYDQLPGSGNPVDSVHRPYMKLTDLLNVYLKSHVIFVDPKSAESFRTELIGILKSYPNWKEKIVAKTVPLNSTSAWLADARAAGITTNAMFYETDTSPNMAQADILGMDYNASQAAWNVLLATGKPVLGHVIPSTAAINIAIGKGAVGAMVSGPNQARLVTIP